MVATFRSLVFLLAISMFFSGCSSFAPSQHATQDYTPVFAAATAGDMNTLRKAIASDPNLVKATEWDKQTLLHDAVGHNQINTANFLLDKGADVNAVTKDGLTPLHIAAQSGYIEIMKLLLARGANINAFDAKGWTPLDRAIKWNHQDAAQHLRQYKDN